MAASPIATPSEFVARAVVFGLLVIAGIGAIVIAGAWWAACIAAVGLLLAVAGLVDVVFALLGDDPAARARASRRVALALGALAVAAYVGRHGARTARGGRAPAADAGDLEQRVALRLLRSSRRAAYAGAWRRPGRRHSGKFGRFAQRMMPRRANARASS
jgi:hypothetical protein